MKTRSKPIVASTATEKILDLQDDPEPPKLLILPRTISKQARVITLAHPRTSTPTRYYHCPETGIYEFTRTVSPRSAYRSLLISLRPGIACVKDQLDLREHTTDSQNYVIPGGDQKGGELTEASDSEPLAPSKGYVSKSAEFFAVTPFDSLFLLLPVLRSDSKSNRARNLLRPADDIFEELSAISKYFLELSNSVNTRKVLVDRLMAVCDMVDAEDETMYGLDVKKLLQELLRKARKMVSSGLPTSIEERFIRKALEVPVLCIKRQDTSSSAIPPDDSPAQPSTPATTDSQGSTLIITSELSTNTNITTPDEEPQSTASLKIVSLLRLRIALDYLISSYIIPTLAAELNSCLASPSSPLDFSPLTKHMSHLTQLRAEAVAARSLANASMKRTLGDDDDAIETRAEKKRKKEEDEKRKKLGESKGVRDLKKVNTTGMRKLSDFFGGKKGK